MDNFSMLDHFVRTAKRQDNASKSARHYTQVLKTVSNQGYLQCLNLEHRRNYYSFLYINKAGFSISGFLSHFYRPTPTANELGCEPAGEANSQEHGAVPAWEGQAVEFGGGC